MSTVIEQSVEARLVAATPRMPSIPATLHYDRADPFAVRMTFPAPATLEGVEVCWTFSRELLIAGMQEPN
ncbi:SsgA family sporulation/cell division regulator, partial [Streptomyces violaceoruber]